MSAHIKTWRERTGLRPTNNLTKIGLETVMRHMQAEITDLRAAMEIMQAAWDAEAELCMKYKEMCMASAQKEAAAPAHDPGPTCVYCAVAIDGAAPVEAYDGAREDIGIWKRRALEAEELNRKFIADVNGSIFMGEPSAPVGLHAAIMALICEAQGVTIPVKQHYAAGFFACRNAAAELASAAIAYPVTIDTDAKYAALILKARSWFKKDPKDDESVIIHDVSGQEILKWMQQIDATDATNVSVVVDADTKLLDWLDTKVVDVIYLDDGRIIDVKGNDIRPSIDAAMKKP